MCGRPRLNRRPLADHKKCRRAKPHGTGLAGLAGSALQGVQPVSVPTNQAGFGTTNAVAGDGSTANNESSTRNAAFTVSNLTINAGETSDPSRLADMVIGELDRRYNDELDGRLMA